MSVHLNKTPRGSQVLLVKASLFSLACDMQRVKGNDIEEMHCNHIHIDTFIYSVCGVCTFKTLAVNGSGSDRS